MTALKWEKHAETAVLTMTNGENRQNPTFVTDFLNALDEIGKDASISSLVITSADPKCWCLGIDVDWLMATYEEKDFDAVKSFMYGLNSIFSRLLLYPMPVIASINGHAYGGGSILACACDFRFMRSDRGFFCFPEVDVNIPLLPGMVAVIEKAVPRHKMEELIYTGNRTVAEDLAKHNVIFKICTDEKELMQDSMAFAGTFNKKRPIFGELKKRLNRAVVEIIETEDPSYIESLKFMM